jgi:hypothetical protein
MLLTAIVNCPSSLGRAATIASTSPIGDGHARATWDLEQNGPRIAGTLDYAALSWFEFPIREAKRPLRNSLTFDWRISSKLYEIADRGTTRVAHSTRVLARGPNRPEKLVGGSICHEAKQSSGVNYFRKLWQPDRKSPRFPEHRAWLR